MKVSIIVPVFNTANYVERCLDSIIHQSYANIEILVINDGSTDNSEEIILNYKKRYNNIKYFKQKNLGASVARRRGLVESSGDYIMFIDSDDYIENDTVKKLTDIIRKEKSDVVKFRASDTRYVLPETSDGVNYLREKLLISDEANRITDEIVSRRSIDLNDDIYNIASSYAEDLLMNLSILDRAQKVYLTNERYYCCGNNPASSTRTKDVHRLLGFIREAYLPLAPLLEYSKKWKLDRDEITEKIHYRIISGICRKVERIMCWRGAKKLHKRIICELRTYLPKQYDMDYLIRKYEKNMLNRVLYRAICQERLSTAKRITLIKRIVKKLLRIRRNH